MQTRGESFIEVVASVMIGLLVSFIANLIILPAYGYPITLSHAVDVAALFTVISIARGYCVRRLFNRLHRRP